MADWTTLPNTAVGVGGLPSGTTVTALRDNPIAIIKSAPGAPRPVSIASFFASGGSNALSGVSAGELVLPSVLWSGQFNDISTGSSSFVSAGSITIGSALSGEVRFRATHSGSFSESRLLRNGVEIAIQQAPASIAFDVTASPGDVFEWQMRKLSGASDTVLNTFSQRADDTVQLFGIPAKVSEVI
jgi:hypothetical protein